MVLILETVDPANDNNNGEWADFLKNIKNTVGVKDIKEVTKGLNIFLNP